MFRHVVKKARRCERTFDRATEERFLVFEGLEM